MLRCSALFIVVVICALALAGSAGADTLQECQDSRPVDVDPMAWTCTSSSGADDATDWVGHADTSGPSGAFGTIVILVLLWSLVPFGIAWYLASQRGESIGSAVLLTLVLGWVGLGIVWYGQQRTRTAVDRLAAPGTGATSSIAERLRVIDDLHDQGVLSDQEHRQQRQRILDRT